MKSSMVSSNVGMGYLGGVASRRGHTACVFDTACAGIMMLIEGEYTVLIDSPNSPWSAVALRNHQLMLQSEKDRGVLGSWNIITTSSSSEMCTSTSA